MLLVVGSAKRAVWVGKIAEWNDSGTEQFCPFFSFCSAAWLAGVDGGFVGNSKIEEKFPPAKPPYSGKGESFSGLTFHLRKKE
jgi:hypothetical protein